MIYQQKNSVGTYYFEMLEYRDFYFSTHMHRHYEVIYVQDGEVVVELDGRKETAKTGQMAFVPSNAIHAYDTPVHSLVDVCIFSADFVPLFAQHISTKQEENCVFSCRPAVREFAERELFCIDRIPDLFTTKAALYAVAGEILANIRFHTTTEKHEILLNRLIQYIAEHYRDELSLKSAAAALGYEPHYLSRCFHKSIPMHFSNYVNLFRVDAATEQLRSSDLSITDIAFNSGFKSIRTFNRAFKEITGQNPHFYQRQK